MLQLVTLMTTINHTYRSHCSLDRYHKGLAQIYPPIYNRAVLFHDKYEQLGTIGDSGAGEKVLSIVVDEHRQKIDRLESPTSDFLAPRRGEVRAIKPPAQGTAAFSPPPLSLFYLIILY